jgi:hypothetical protein
LFDGDVFANDSPQHGDVILDGLVEIECATLE